MLSTVLLPLLYAWRHLRQEGRVGKTVKKGGEKADLCKSRRSKDSFGAIVREGCTIQELRGLRKEQSFRKVMGSLLRDIKVQQSSLEDISASGNIIAV